MNPQKTALLKEVLSQNRPSLKGVSCQQCGTPMPPIVMHGVGKILEHYEPARHFLAKCRNCGAWHRFDEETQSWIADERASALAATKFSGKRNVH